MDKTAEQIVRMRMHGLYLSRKCGDLIELSRELMGLHCWFSRNVVFSALIRGADISGWRTALTKTWLYRGTLHGAVYEELPLLLALHREDSFDWLFDGDQGRIEDLAGKVLALMEDGVFSRAEMRRIFADEYEEPVIQRVFSPWGGIFVYLARRGKVAFRDMKSRDFDLIAAEPVLTGKEALSRLLPRFFAVYGPATLADAAWFFGLGREWRDTLASLDLDSFRRLEYGGDTYYFTGERTSENDIPELTLLSGFDPVLVSYAERGAMLPAEYKSRVVLKSGICLPTIAVNGQVAGVWNIKKGSPEVAFFSSQPRRIQDAAWERVEEIRLRAVGI